MMKIEILTVGIIAGFVLVAGDASAQRGMDFGTLDTNSDGSLTLEEIQAASETRFRDADTDGDGTLSLAELTAQAENSAGDRATKIIARFDANDDGVLSPDEMRGNRPDRIARMFEHVDQNEDGVITQEEFAQRREGHGRGRDRGHWFGRK